MLKQIEELYQIVGNLKIKSVEMNPKNNFVNDKICTNNQFENQRKELNFFNSSENKHKEGKTKVLYQQNTLPILSIQIKKIPPSNLLNSLMTFQDLLIIPENIYNLDLIFSKVDNLCKNMRVNIKVKEDLIHEISKYWLKFLMMFKDLIEPHSNTNSNFKQLFDLLVKFNFEGFFQRGSQNEPLKTKFQIVLEDRKHLYIGDILESEDNCYNGFGIFLSNISMFEGNCYFGSWAKGKKNGSGIYYHNFKEFYCGEWEEDSMKGYGSYTWNIKGKNVYYEGQWNKNKMNGIGKLYIENFLAYEGEWLDGKKHGEGYQKLPDSKQIFFGHWKDDIRLGPGNLNSFGLNEKCLSGYWNGENVMTNS